MRLKDRDRHRTKLFTTMLTTYGYSLMAGALFDPILKHTPLRWYNVLVGLMAVAMQSYALYLAPKGEKDDG